ncbi:MAG: adenylyl-sulfate kinase [Negativicutes bacterium]|jgi:bifunctional enzyme CysN/CysC
MNAETINKPEMTVVIIGHVDHGKSTLIGRLLFDTRQVQADKIEFARQRSTEQGRELEFAYLLDGLSEEQEQGITIDFTQTRITLADRPFIIADAPGHREFLKNMLSGASKADAAILVIDAVEGVSEQSRRHGWLLTLLGIQQLVVVVNKMDLCGWSQAVFAAIKNEFAEFLAQIGLTALGYIPASAYQGDNVLVKSVNMPWYTGATVAGQFAEFCPPSEQSRTLRLPVQALYRFDSRRLLAGRIEAGQLALNQTIVVWPTGEQAQIKAIDCWPEERRDTADQGRCVAVELTKPLFVERGMVVADSARPPLISRRMRVRLVWLGRAPLAAGQRYKIKIGFQESFAWWEKIERVIDIGNIGEASPDCVPAGFVGEGIIALDQPLVFDVFAELPATGRFVLVDGWQIAGGGIIIEALSAVNAAESKPFRQDNTATSRNETLFPVTGAVNKELRRQQNGHHSLVIWLTGLSGAGKTTIANGLNEQLFTSGVHAYVLDGDNLRCGLNKDLDFSENGRRENIRRIGETAKILVDAGLVVIVACISPYSDDRKAVRAGLCSDEFVEVFVNCPLAVCEQRDKKALYTKARRGEIANFTGIDSCYEPPQQPEIIIDSELLTVDAGVELILDYLRNHFEFVL